MCEDNNNLLLHKN